MGKFEHIDADLEDWVVADLDAAVAAGESTTAGELAGRIITEWAAGRRADTPEFVEAATRAIAESRADHRPGVPAEEFFDRLEAKYAVVAGTDGAR
jgi:hypothetical protein